MLFSRIQKPFFQRCLALFGQATLVLFLAANGKAERLPIKTYTVADGLLRDTVYKIKQDSRGFLWFCTGEGISRSDGYGFTNFTVADGLPGGAVNDFLETRRGEIFIATDGGLAKLNATTANNANQSPQSKIANRNDALFTVVAPDNPKAKTIEVLLEDESGTVWVGTSGGLYRLNAADEFEVINLGESKNETKEIAVTAIVKDRRGALWVGTHGGGLFRLAANGAVTQFTSADGMPGNIIASLLEDRNGKLWAGMRWDGATAGLVRLNAEADGTKDKPIVARAFTAADGLPSNWIPAMLNTSDGKFWLATVAGLCEWQGENAKSVCKTYRAENDLCDRDVWSLAEDKDGNLWTGSSCGAKKIARYGFTTYGEADGIESIPVNSIFENRIGELFATINTNGTRMIYRFADGKFVAAEPHLPPGIDSPGWGWKQTVWQDSVGAWLIPTVNGLYEFPPQTKFENINRTTMRKISPATKGSEIFRLFEDSRGDLWIATTNGGRELWRWERGANIWHDYTAQLLSAPSRLVSSFVEDESGNLWIGTGTDDALTGGELMRYRNGEFKIFTEADGLSDGWIRDLYVDHAGRLWIANSKNGLLRLDDVNAEKLNFVRYSTAEGLSSAGAYCITEDGYGRIYVGSARGVDRLNPDTKQVENFTTADGLPSSYIEIAYRDKNNNLWFGTHDGLTKYVPEPERKRIAPNALIIGLRVNGEPQAVSILGETAVSNLDLNFDQRQVSVDFIGLGASLGEKLKYEYRFANTDWTQTSERTVNFANLSAGNYKFEIRAVTADRLTSAPATLAFHIAAPIYLQPWFLLAAVLLTGGIIFYAYRYRVARLLELERMRTRIATDLHDDIGANLTKISVLSEVAQRRLAMGAIDAGGGNLLENIAETSRESVSAMSDIVWAINPKKDSLVDLTRRMRRYAEEILEQRDIFLEFDSTVAELRLDANVRRNVYLIFKESINNIVRHSRATSVRVDFRAEQTALVLIIADDGAGFETELEIDGNGLASMRKRAAELGGTLEINSAQAKGTTIILRFGLTRGFWT